MKVADYFKKLIMLQKTGHDSALCSICSANEFVIEAAIEYGRDHEQAVLIEATANQVNQFGGYTGMKPLDFAAYVKRIAKNTGLPEDRLLLGGDHLGPLVWQEEPEETAMEKAEALIKAYVTAGFKKIHIDTSMKLLGDLKNERLPDESIAKRSARLCLAAEKAAEAEDRPVYVIGSEVPIPGGATENEEKLRVTKVCDLKNTMTMFRRIYAESGLHDAWERIVAVVVQPGVEFSDNSITLYDPDNARELITYAKSLEKIVLEGHSTDYQPKRALDAMRHDGIAILKVGPALTFALREALFALQQMENILYPFSPQRGYSHFSEILEQKLMEDPKHWIKHYHGNESTLSYARKFSLSDRCRYYLEDVTVKRAISRLLMNINDMDVPYGLLSQFFPMRKEGLHAYREKMTAQWLIKENIKDVIRTYH